MANAFKNDSPGCGCGCTTTTPGITGCFCPSTPSTVTVTVNDPSTTGFNFSGSHTCNYVGRQNGNQRWRGPLLYGRFFTAFECLSNGQGYQYGRVDTNTGNILPFVSWLTPSRITCSPWGCFNGASGIGGNPNTTGSATGGTGSTGGTMVQGMAPPTLLTQAGNFLAAAGTQLMAGNPIASDEVQIQRKAICEICPLYTASKSCLKCGCTAMDLKISWQTSECPEGRW